MSPNRTHTALVLNGPNLNLLGRREPEVYGATTLAEIEAECTMVAARLNLEIDFRQSNHEGTLIDAIHESFDRFDGIVINPGGLSHTSVALQDALAAVSVPVVEVHVSNVHRREEFRHMSYVSAVASAVIIGAGAHGYTLALEHLAWLLDDGGGVLVGAADS
ncbi:MAG: type II 3-dehydroquinate dehydratase [Nocardioidaceae bacterium]|nr:type II 3-dehydroquinate dehydratase [Nocardioidaceae bacterium]